MSAPLPLPDRPSAEQLASLRAALSRDHEARGPALAFGIAPLDDRLADRGLDSAGLHEIAAAILPDGNSIRLDNMPATDAGGYSGLADKVDFHTWTLLRGVAIATLLGVGSEVTIRGENDLVQAIRQSAQTNTARAGDQITQRNLDVQPTITIRAGAPVRVLVTRDLVLAPWRGKAS